MIDPWTSSALPRTTVHLTNPVVDFSGFNAGAFQCLSQLREEPTIDRYKELKELLQREVMHPFTRYRDDLVVNWVLPNRLPFETERNVFSRIPKNDFGAGGANSHLWLSFYRHGYRRLTDLQLAHSIGPDGFTVGLYLNKRMRPHSAFSHMLRERGEEFLRVLDGLTRHERVWDVRFYTSSGRALLTSDVATANDRVRRGVHTLWIRSRVSAERVVELAGALVPWAIGGLGELWPIYRLILTADEG